MRFTEYKLAGMWVIEFEPHEDGRGAFARAWCEREFADHGLVNHIAQINTVRTREAGTVRGLHFQCEPYWETKVIRCLRGAACVVAVDVRSESPTRLEYVSVTLSDDCGRLLYVPAGFAQGYQTLRDDTEILYLMSEQYVAQAQRGYRYDDPAFHIRWPLAVTHISAKDRQWAAFT